MAGVVVVGNSVFGLLSPQLSQVYGLVPFRILIRKGCQNHWLATNRTPVTLPEISGLRQIDEPIDRFLQVSRFGRL